MPGFVLTWSNADKAAIDAEIRSFSLEGTEICRVLAYLVQIALDGATVMNQNLHSIVNGKDLHAVCPFGTIGAYYTYASAPAAEMYLLGCFSKHYQHSAIATARLVNVP